MSLGEKVKALREKKGMNQKQLSEASLITQATISRIESGKVNQLKSDALKRLADALGSTVDYLVDKADQLTPEDVMKADKTAKYLFRGYEKLSSDGRKQLIDFVQFLEGKGEGMFTELARTRVAMAEAEKAMAQAVVKIEELRTRIREVAKLVQEIAGHDAKIERWLDSVKEEL